MIQTINVRKIYWFAMKGLTSSVDVSFGQESLDRGRLRAVKSGGIFSLVSVISL